MPYQPHIDGLRAVAVLSVLFYHIGIAVFPGGYVGVDIFFVISGFLITRLIVAEVRSSGHFRFTDFYIRRVRRLFPALAVTIAASFAASAILFPPEYLKEFGGSAGTAIVGLSNFFFWSQSGYFDTASEFKPLLHTWSLSVEEQFYWFWPLFLLGAWRLGGSRSTLATIYITAAASFLLNLLFHFVDVTLYLPASFTGVFSDRHAATFYMLPFRMFELAIGGAMVWVVERRATARGLEEVVAVAGFSLIAIPVALYNEALFFPSYYALAPCVGAAGIIYSSRSRLVAWALCGAYARGLGLLSYSLYLVHWPIIVFYRYAVDRPIAFPDQVTIVAASLVSAALLYRFIENPIHKGRAAYLKEWPAVFGSAACIAVPLVALGAGTFQSNGWLWRYPPQIVQMIDHKNLWFSVPPIEGNCFLTISQPDSALSPSCYTPPRNGKPNILLAGDSIAFALFHGMQKAFEGEANILLWTASACPPAIGVDIPERPYCREANDRLFAEIIPQNRYDLVVLASFANEQQLYKGFPEVRRTLERQGTNYVLLGRPLGYQDALAALVARHGRTEGLDAYIASRQRPWNSCDSGELGYDKLVARERFFSVKQALCPSGSPVWRDGVHLFTSDWFHYSHYGSLFVAGHLREWLRETGRI